MGFSLPTVPRLRNPAAMDSLALPSNLRRLAVVLLCGLLSACVLPIKDATRQVAVLGGAMRVRAPDHYCIDTRSARASDDTAVVLIGRCKAAGRVAAALVTVTVGRSASAGVLLAAPEALRAFLSSPDGRRALSRSGRAEDVQVLESGVLDDQVLLHLNDRAEGDYWRAIIGVRGRLVTISASGAEGVPLTPVRGRRLVAQTVAALRAANPAE